MKVKQVYTDFQTPGNLQKHMLRVAALASIILEKWSDLSLDKESIINTCAIHDIAKPMNFDLAKQAQFGMSEPEIEDLRQLQERIKADFGTDEHQATVNIAKELGCHANVQEYLDNLEWKYISRLSANQEIASLIPIYCDMRIGTKGILPLKTRLEDLKNRTGIDEYEDNLKNGTALEQLIASNSNIDLNSISDEQLTQRFKEILDREI